MQIYTISPQDKYSIFNNEFVQALNINDAMKKFYDKESELALSGEEISIQ